MTANKAGREHPFFRGTPGFRHIGNGIVLADESFGRGEKTTMEIQTFFLAEEITRISAGRHDVRRAVVSVMQCTPDTPLPIRFTLPALLVLRRENTSGEALVRLRFDLVDEDGKPTGLPRRWEAKAAFADENRLLYIMAKLAFEFPRPGRYRLDITNADAPDGSVYQYAIDVVLKES